MDATFIETQKLEINNLNAHDLIKKYDSGIKDELETLMKDSQKLRKINAYREPGHTKIAENYLPLPVNIERIIKNTLNTISTGMQISKENIYERIKILETELYPSQMINDIRNSDAMTLFKIHLHEHLSTKKLYDLQITDEQLDFIIEDIIYKFNQAKISPGEMCGVLAA
jgi:hypothetical protein